MKIAAREIMCNLSMTGRKKKSKFVSRKISVKPAISKHGKEISKVGTKIGSGHRDKAIYLMISNDMPNQVAAGEDDIVVKGFNGGKDIVRTVVSNPNKDSIFMNPLFIINNNLMEHHCDPTSSNIECLDLTILVNKKGNILVDNGEACVEHEMTYVCA